VTAALLGAVLLVNSHGGWSLERARGVLAARPYTITDTSQLDRPEYKLTFSPRAAKALRHGFVFSGRAHDELTDADVVVRFTFRRPGRIVGFRGPMADLSQPSFPIRAAFYYAWYPEAWFRGAVYPYSRFHPSLAFYAANDAAVIRGQIDALRYAHFAAGIYSWWGKDGYPPTDLRFWRYLAAARTTPFRWAIYYEREGYEDPSVERIRSELEYMKAEYASQPAYLKVDGRFVVFVYGSSQDSCGMAERWRDANATVGAYLVLKAFPGYRDCAAQPDAWHQYSGDQAEYGLLPDSFMIAPGFDEVQEWATPSGYGAYLDALHDGIP
jgi:hypothetical protein